MKKSGDVHEGIWILAAISFFTALISVGIGLQVFSLLDVLGTGGLPLNDPTTGAPLGTVGSGVFAGIGFGLVALGVLSYFVGRGLLKAKNWSRVAVAAIAALYGISSISALFNSMFISGIVGLGIAGLIIWYLYFKESSKKYFK
jgi:hypothetical protein